MPMKVWPILMTCVSMWSVSIFALSGFTISMSPTIRKPVAVIFAARSSVDFAGIKSPAICSRTNSSNGLSALNALMR